MYNLVKPNQKIPFFSKDAHLYRRSGDYNAGNKVCQSILEAVGNTPLVKLNKIPKDHGLECEIYVKCEFMNPSGSIKDRIAVAMIDDAVKHGVVNSATTFVEPTSGNTGIGVAFKAAVMGNKSIIITTEKNSDEKVSTMRVLGAEVLQISTQASTMALARLIKDCDPNAAIMPDQFENDVNPRTHYMYTAEEILIALDNKVDLVAMGAGSGGTLSGVSHKFKERCPECIVVGADPDGSVMLNKHGKVHPFLVEGIGGSTIPIVLDKSLVDDVQVATDQESFLMARELMKKEGILCGGSSGTSMVAAIKAAKKYNLGAGKRVVVILPDGIRNYMTKFVCDQWMEAHLFMDPPQHTMKWWMEPVTKLKCDHKFPKIENKFTCQQALEAMEDASLAIVVDFNGFFVGAVTKDCFRHTATNPVKVPNQDSESFNFQDPVTNHLDRCCFTMARNGKKGMPTIGLISRILDITTFVVIGTNKQDGDKECFIPDGVVTCDMVLQYIIDSQ